MYGYRIRLLEYDFTPPTPYRNHRLGDPGGCAAGTVFPTVLI